MHNNNLSEVEYIYLDGGSVLVTRNTPDGDNIAKELGFDPQDYEKILMATIATQTPEETANFWHIETLEKEYDILNNFHTKMCEYLNKPYTPELITKLSEYRIKADFSLKPGITEALQRLSKKYKLGVLSNALPSRRHFELKLENIDKYFDPIILSFEEGIQKPNVELYKIGIERAQVNPQKVLFVDDKPSYLRGAKESGIANLILHTSKETNPNNKGVDEYPHIDNLIELCELLGV